MGKKYYMVPVKKFSGKTHTSGSASKRLCRFGAGRILPRIKAFEREIDGVRQERDIEHVHWMRVASRRLRSALPLFASCFQRKDYRRWTKSIRAITRALSTARDTDVQIAFFEIWSVREPHTSKDMDGISRFLSLLREKRKGEQAVVVSALDTIEREQIFTELTAALRVIKNQEMPKRSGSPHRLYLIAAKRITNAIDEIIQYEQSVSDPADVAGHHELRIAVKKLRYIIEIFRPLYKNRLRPSIKDLKKLQTILGEIHDCDVWTAMLSGSSLDEPLTGGIGPGLLPPDLLSEKVLVQLKEDRKRRRQQLYEELVLLWSEIGRQKIWDILKKTVDTTK